MKSPSSLSSYEQYKLADPELFPKEEPLPALPDLFMLGIDDPDVSPAELVRNLEIYAGTDEVVDRLDEIRSTARALLDYANAAETVLVQLEEARHEAWQGEEEYLDFLLSRESWSFIGYWIDLHLNGPCSGLKDAAPRLWKTLATFTRAIEEQFPSEMDEEDE